MSGLGEAGFEDSKIPVPFPDKLSQTRVLSPDDESQKTGPGIARNILKKVMQTHTQKINNLILPENILIFSINIYIISKFIHLYNRLL
jgi:hypothetical protein